MAFLNSITGSNAPDAELVSSYRQTNQIDVLGQLYARYMELVYGVCLKYLKEPEEAQDAVMSIFEELVAKLHKHEVENFKSWLYTLAKNYCLMKLRAGKRTPVVKMGDKIVQSEETEHLQDVFKKEEDLDRLHACLETLPGHQKTTIQLFYLEEKCYNEIAETTGLEWNKVRSSIQNGRRNLKLCMEKNADKLVEK